MPRMVDQETIDLALQQYEEFKGEPAEEVTMSLWTYRLVQKMGIDMHVPVNVKEDTPHHMIYFHERGRYRDAEQG